MTETQIKLTLIKFLMNNHPDSIIASEVTYDFGNRRADIAMLDNQSNLLYAYEIKSMHDNTARLLSQASSYKNFFDFCYIVCEKENVKTIQKITPKTIGIIVITPKTVKLIRKSHLFKKQSKISLTSILPTKNLRKLVKLTTNASQLELAHKVANSFSKEQLIKISRSYVKERYRDNYNLMKNEMGKELTPDDLLIITRKFPKHIL